MEILQSDVIAECIENMLVERPELKESLKAIMDFQPVKRQEALGDAGLGLAPNSPITTELAIKVPEYLLAAMFKHLELKTIKNGFLSKFYNAFTGKEFKESLEQSQLPRDGGFNFDKWVEHLIKHEYLIPLKPEDEEKYDPNAVFTCAYFVDKQIKNDQFEYEPEVPKKDLEKLMAKLFGYMKEVTKLYKVEFVAKEQSFDPYQVPAFLAFIKETACLKKVDLENLEKNERLAYFINCFQITSFYRLALEAGSKGVKKTGLLSYVGLGKGQTFNFKLGSESQFVFSADDILHGVLRKNTKKYSAYFAQFKGGDPRGTLLSVQDKRIIVFYHLEHVGLEAATFEKLDSETLEYSLPLLLKGWTQKNLHYNSVEKTLSEQTQSNLNGWLSLPIYLEKNYLADFDNQEVNMVLFLNDSWESSKFKRKELVVLDQIIGWQWSVGELEDNLESQTVVVIYDTLEDISKLVGSSSNRGHK